MRRAPAVLALAILAPLPLGAQAAPTPDAPRLLQRPTISRNAIAFEYGGDIWVVPRTGGDARRLTAGAGLETNPVFSPDGDRVAFAADYEGNTDVYVVDAAGGLPVRLTWHPVADVPVGWTPDGRILFRSTRLSATRHARLFTVAPAGGPAAAVDLPSGHDGSFAPGGDRLAYLPFEPANVAWKRYRGGRTTPIWLVNLADASVEKVPRDNSTDASPMWVGDRVFFLSDREGPTALFAYDTKSRQVARVVKDGRYEIKSAAATRDAIVLERFGSLHLYDIASGTEREVPVRIAADLPSVRPRWTNVGRGLRNPAVSPTGARALFEARGEIVTVPASKGSMRNLTDSPGVADRDPAWSPDGRRVAYFSDEDGEYALHLRDQAGAGAVKKIDLGRPASFFYAPVWSPDSRKIAFHDKRLQLWYVDVDAASPKPVKVGEQSYEYPERTLDPAWSPDSRWLAWSRMLPSHLHAVVVHSLETGKTTQVTDGLSDARSPQFDRDGKHLYFTASTDAGQAAGWLDMSSYDRPVTRSVYVTVLRRDLPSPLAPESDEEKAVAEAAAAATAAKPGAAPAKPAAAPDVRIDFDGIGQRILALPVPARDYERIVAGKAGSLFLVEREFVPVPASTEMSEPPPVTVHRFDLAKRKLDKAFDGVSAFVLAANGEKALVRQRDAWSILPAMEPAKPGDGGPLATAALEVLVDPRAEWRQMYRESWRIQRDFFWEPKYHGADIAALEKRYEPFVAGLSSRADLTALMNEMFGELTVGHLYVRGGDLPAARPVPVGLLGADYEVANGRYRFARVYSGENWNPSLRAPLTEPGVNVRAGEYLLAVDGREVRASQDVHSYFEATANRQVSLRIGPSPDGRGARDVVVVPVANEFALRNRAWVEDNRRKVDQLGGGRIAYVYVPNTAAAGYTYFNRYYFSQLDREGVVIDERFNGGGSIADYIVDQVTKTRRSIIVSREGMPTKSPLATIYGPKVMLVNEAAGSGGDYLPWLFRHAKAGTIVGTRTWGGLVGVYDYPPLIDGGTVTAPRVAITNLEGELDVENVGVAPDVEVEFDPKSWRAGRDPQLEKGVEIVLEQLKANPKWTAPSVVYPNYHPANADRGGSQ